MRRSLLDIAGLVIAALAAMAAPEGALARGRVTERPTTIEFTACVLPSEACPTPRDVIVLVVEGEERRTAVSDLTVVQGTALAGSLLSDLRMRPVRVLGPDELRRKLAPGARMRVRGVLRLRSRHLFVESVTPPKD